MVPEATGFTACAGRGVRAIVDRCPVEVLSPAAYAGLAIRAVAEIESGGATAVVVTADGQAIGVLGLHDQTRPGAAAAVQALHALTGADLTVDTADVVTVGDDLSAIAAVVALSRRARRLVIANLVIAATVITVLVTWICSGTCRYRWGGGPRGFDHPGHPQWPAAVG
ncbi:hypothetical protein [Mycobacterium sp. DL440]|uniref:hypothetical protein n=1 Tax=Mycobacterium sp. DL440 TaxID=2675523 RepID=UPI001421790F